jgi:hypothetical protein
MKGENVVISELVTESEDVCNLATELASLTGDSLEGAIVTALRAGIAREHARIAREERIMAITREIARSARYGASTGYAMAG